MRRFKWLTGLGCLGLCLLAPAQGGAHSENRVISTVIENLPEILKVTQAADVLGIDAREHTVQLRVDEEDLKAIDRAHLAHKILSSHKLVTSGSIAEYADTSEVASLLAQYATAYPDLAEVFEVGQTTEGRRIPGIKLGSRVASSKGKPAILFNGMHHARELMSAEIALDIIHELLVHYASDAEVRAWLDNYQILVVPQVNPDGNKLVHERDRWWRKNTWQKWGQVYGVDLNRNYPTLWNGCDGSSSSVFKQDYHGPSAASEPETQAMMALVARVKPVFNISYHSYSEIIIYPFGCRSRENSSASLFRTIGTSMSEAIVDDEGRSGTYQVGTAPELLYEADGTDLDYQWAEHNVMAYTIEVNSQALGFQPDYQTWRNKTVENQRGGWKTLLRRMGEGAVRAELHSSNPITYLIDEEAASGFVPWDEVSPQLSRSLRPQKLLFQPLAAGSYRLRVFTAGELSKEIRFEIGTSVLDLGLLELD